MRSVLLSTSPMCLIDAATVFQALGDIQGLHAALPRLWGGSRAAAMGGSRNPASLDRQHARTRCHPVSIHPFPHLGAGGWDQVLGSDGNDSELPMWAAAACFAAPILASISLSFDRRASSLLCCQSRAQQRPSALRCLPGIARRRMLCLRRSGAAPATGSPASDARAVGLILPRLQNVGRLHSTY